MNGHEIREPISPRQHTYPGVLEAREKHGTALYSAATPEQFYRAALHLLRKRHYAGWYPEPEKHLDAHLRDLGRRENDTEWLKLVRQCLGMSICDDGRLHEAGRIAWGLLCDRSDYEYEGVKFISLTLVGEGGGDRLDWLDRNWLRLLPPKAIPDWWSGSQPPTVGDLYTAAREAHGVDASELVSRLIEFHATMLARGPKPDLPPGTRVTFRGGEHDTDGEVYGLGDLWAVRLVGRDRPARADHCKPAESRPIESEA